VVTQHCWCYRHCLQLHGLNTKSKHKKHKQNAQTKHKPHLFINTQRCCQNYIICTCWHPGFPILFFECKKNTLLWHSEIHSNSVITTSVYVNSCLVLQTVCGTNLFINIHAEILSSCWKISTLNHTKILWFLWLYKCNQITSSMLVLNSCNSQKTSDIKIVFVPYFPLHSKHSGRPINIHRLFSNPSYSLKTDRELNVVFKSFFAFSYAKFPNTCIGTVSY
jgi:hypothetical protein